MDNTELRTTPISVGELFRQDPMDERVMIAKINQLLLRDSYKNPLLKWGQVCLPCGVVNKANIITCQKAFNSSKGWSVYESTILSYCGTDCDNYEKGSSAYHVVMCMITPQPKIVPKKKEPSIWSKLWKKH